MRLRRVPVMFASNVQPRKRLKPAPKPWGFCPLRYREHPGWLKVCTDCGGRRPDTEQKP